MYIYLYIYIFICIYIYMCIHIKGPEGGCVFLWAR